MQAARNQFLASTPASRSTPFTQHPATLHNSTPLSHFFLATVLSTSLLLLPTSQKSYSFTDYWTSSPWQGALCPTPPCLLTPMLTAATGASHAGTQIAPICPPGLPDQFRLDPTVHFPPHTTDFLDFSPTTPPQSPTSPHTFSANPTTTRARSRYVTDRQPDHTADQPQLIGTSNFYCEAAQNSAYSVVSPKHTFCLTTPQLLPHRKRNSTPIWSFFLFSLSLNLFDTIFVLSAAFYRS